MDVKEYIASGIIERYVLGSVSPQESQEVECMSHIYPEIKEELTALQSSIEQMAQASAVEPPQNVKAKIMERIKTEAQTITKEETEKANAKIVQMTPSKGRVNLYKYGIAASIVIAVALGVYTTTLQSDKAQIAQQLQQNKEQVEALATEKQELQQYAEQTSNYVAFLKDASTQKIQMGGTENHPEALATVFWNANSSKVVLEVNNLPTPPSDKQYQLWAIVDGAPQDMGVFDMTNASSLVDMKEASSAQAFAITLEPKGGSEAPTLEQMYVIGNVAS